jgi:hypothetical protein
MCLLTHEQNPRCMQASMCTYIHAYFLFKHAQMHLHTPNKHTCRHAYMHTYVHAYIHVTNIHTYMSHACIHYIHTYIHSCITYTQHTYIHTYTHEHTYIHTYIQTYTSKTVNAACDIQKTPLCMHVCAYVHMSSKHAELHVCLLIINMTCTFHTHLRACIHSSTHKHTHIYIHADIFRNVLRIHIRVLVPKR